MLTYVLIDGNSLWWRTFCATPTPTMAEYRFLEILCRLYDETNQGRIIVTWDSWCQWRRTIHPSYKEQRGRTPEMLKKRDEVYRALNKFLPYLQLILPCFFGIDSEADDVIAVLCDLLPGKKIIYGTDHDLFQLLSDKVSMRRVRFNPTRIEILTKTNLKEKEGFTPIQARWVQAICGCSSDNVPGSRVPEKLVVQILDNWQQTSCHRRDDLQELGSRMLTPGWAKRWNNHFQFQMMRNLQLVSLGHKPVELLSMNTPNLSLAQQYLRRRKFMTIEQTVLDDLLCAS